MNKLKVISLMGICFLFVGCSNSVNTASNNLNVEQYPQKRSVDWCEKNYLSADVSVNERRANAKHCDSQAARDYIEAKNHRDSRDTL